MNISASLFKRRRIGKAAGRHRVGELRPDLAGWMTSSNISSRAPDRTALQWLLATQLLACAPLVFELSIWVSLALFAVLAWRYGTERLQLYRPGRWVRYGLLAIVIAGVYADYGSIFGRDPGLALLLLLCGLKTLELRSVRDAMLIVFVQYIVLAGGFLFDQSLPGGLWAALAVAVSLVTLMRLQQPIAARSAFRLAGELLLKALPLLLIFYALFPRMSGTLWALPTDARAARTGMSDEMRPGSIRDVSESTDIALRVDFAGDSPPARQLYWRGLVLWDSDGKTWRRGSPPTNPARLRPLGTPVRYRVTLEPSSNAWLYALDLPATAPEGARMRPEFTLVRAEPARERISYDLISYTQYSTGPLADSERDAALKLPPLSARVRALATELSSQAAQPVAIAQAVLDRFRRENFVYTLSPPLLLDDPVDQFLFETRRGFCEHYAAAFVTLMRAAGVPARVVTGYQGGELNPAGRYLIVRQSDAHAWAEIWLAERGWVRVDPTAAVAPERIEFGLDAIRRLEAQGLVPGNVGTDALAQALALPWFEYALRQTRLYWDYTNIAWYRWVVDYRKDSQENFLRALGFETIEWPRVLAVLGGASVLVMIGYVVWSRRAPPPDPLQRIYLRFCRRLARAGLARAPYEGPLAFAARAGAARPDLRLPVDNITARYVELRYRPRSSNADFGELRRLVAEFRAKRRQR